MGVSRVFHMLTSVALTVGLFLAALVGGPSVGGVQAERPAAAQAQVAAAKKVRKGRIRVILTGIGTYTITRKSVTRTGTTTRTWRVKPGRYTIKAPGATVDFPKVKVRAGMRVRVRVTFPAPPTPAQPLRRFNPDTIVASTYHTCAIDTAGRPWCWGDDFRGQLGDGNNGQANEPSPVAVATNLEFTRLTAGTWHTCGIDTAGRAWCWGYDFQGQLGDGNDGQADEHTPVAVAGNHVFTRLSASYGHTCGIDTTGKAWCWGWDSHGQLGDGDDGQAAEYAPVPVAASLTFTTLVAGAAHTCGIDTTGKAWCWGLDHQGQLGDGNDGQAPEYAPSAVASSEAFTQITVGDSFTCATDVQGRSWCWGYDNYGQLGDGDDGQGSEYTPVPVAGGHQFARLTAGAWHACAIDRTGKAWCWGSDQNGRLGDGNDGQADQPSPVAVATCAVLTHVTAGGAHTCALEWTGKAWCWGYDHYGQLGDGNDGQADEFAPVLVAGDHIFATHIFATTW